LKLPVTFAPPHGHSQGEVFQWAWHPDHALNVCPGSVRYQRDRTADCKLRAAHSASTHAIPAGTLVTVPSAESGNTAGRHYRLRGAASRAVNSLGR